MIEINLLPGSGKKSRGGRATSAGLGAAVSDLGARVKDPFMLGAAAAVALSTLVVAGLWFTQTAEARELGEREQQAVQDSTRYAAVLKERRKAESQRDSVMRQLNIIKAIDNDRYVWPHVMDDVSKALPPYTWLTSVVQTSVAQTAQSVEGTPSDSAPPPPGMKFRITGHTVDIQALTRFMRLLEQSPFVQNVSLTRSNLAMVEGKEVTDFSLEAEFQRPDSSAIRLVPVALTVR